MPPGPPRRSAARPSGAASSASSRPRSTAWPTALPSPLRGEDRRSLALLQLTRVLFLYFIQAKGWLGGRERFLAEEVDRCLARKRRIHRDLLRPLFFGTLNRPHGGAESRSAAVRRASRFSTAACSSRTRSSARSGATSPTRVWRDAFDRLFERFHFVVAEAGDAGGIAPDMLGRVFEGVMAPDARRASGTYYTPAALVRSMLDAALVALVAGRARLRPRRRRSGGSPSGDPAAVALLESRHAARSGGGLGRVPAGRARAPLRRWRRATGSDRRACRRRILQRNLFGVDRSAAAVRLTELRLWLAVIADDPRGAARARSSRCPTSTASSARATACSSRSGMAVRLHAVDPGAAAAVARPPARARHGHRRPQARAGARSSGRRSVARRTTAFAARRRSRAARSHRRVPRRGAERGPVRRAARHRSGAPRAARGRRARSSAPFAARGARSSGSARCPGSTTRATSPTCSPAAASTSSSATRRGSARRRSPPEMRRRLAGRYRWWRGAGSGVRPPARSGGRVPRTRARARRARRRRRPAGAGQARDRRVRRRGAARARLDDHAAPRGRPHGPPGRRVRRDGLSARAHRPKRAPRRRAPVRATSARHPSGPAYRRRDFAAAGRGSLTADRARDVIARLLREHPALGERLTCHLGVKTGANRVFLDPPDTVEPWLRTLGGPGPRPAAVPGPCRGDACSGPTRRDGSPLAAAPARRGRTSPLARGRRFAPARTIAGGPPWTLFRTTAAVGAPPRRLGRPRPPADRVRAHGRSITPITSRSTPATSRPPARRRRRSVSPRGSTRPGCAPSPGSARCPPSGGFHRFTAAVVSRLPLPASGAHRRRARWPPRGRAAMASRCRRSSMTSRPGTSTCPPATAPRWPASWPPAPRIVAESLAAVTDPLRTGLACRAARAVAWRWRARWRGACAAAGKPEGRRRPGCCRARCEASGACWPRSSGSAARCSPIRSAAARRYVALAVAAALRRPARLPGPRDAGAPVARLAAGGSACRSRSAPTSRRAEAAFPRTASGLVIIDESHHFRNPHTRRYRHVAPWLVGRRVLLLSATPIVNRLDDLAHQLLLGVRDDALLADGVVSLRAALTRRVRHRRARPIGRRGDREAGPRPGANAAPERADPPEEESGRRIAREPGPAPTLAAPADRGADARRAAPGRGLEPGGARGGAPALPRPAAPRRRRAPSRSRVQPRRAAGVRRRARRPAGAVGARGRRRRRPGAGARGPRHDRCGAGRGRHVQPTHPTPSSIGCGRSSPTDVPRSSSRRVARRCATCATGSAFAVAWCTGDRAGLGHCSAPRSSVMQLVSG